MESTFVISALIFFPLLLTVIRRPAWCLWYFHSLVTAESFHAGCRKCRTSICMNASITSRTEGIPGSLLVEIAIITDLKDNERARFQKWRGYCSRLAKQKHHNLIVTLPPPTLYVNSMSFQCFSVPVNAYAVTHIISWRYKLAAFYLAGKRVARQGIGVTRTRQSKERGIPTANTRDTRDRMIVNGKHVVDFWRYMEPHDRMSQMAEAGGRDLWKAWKAEGLTRARGFYKGS